MKYAVFEHGGKQFVASEGQLIEVDRLAQQTGASIEFSQVLLLRENDHVEVGSPYVRGAKVKARVAAHVKGPKLRVFKYRPKQRYRVRQGHRQGLTQIEIESIGGAKAAEGRASAKAETESKAESKGEPKARSAPRKAAAKTTKRTAAARKKAEPAAKPKSQASKAGAKRKPSAPAKKAARKKTGGSN